MNKFHVLLLYVSVILPAMLQPGCGRMPGKQVVLLQEDFGSLPRGPLGSELVAETEYHYFHQARPVGDWAVSTFRYNLPPSWHIRRTGEESILFQEEMNPDRHWHPMVVAGSPLWKDYTLRVSFKPDSCGPRCGTAFRYQHDRSYYFFGIENDSVKLIMVNHGKAFRRPDEKLLAGVPFSSASAECIELKVMVNAESIQASIDGGPELAVEDSVFRQGRIALLADGPASFYSVMVTTEGKAYRRYLEESEHHEALTDSLIAANPRTVIYKKINTEGFGVGRNLRFGDLDGDGETDVLIGQVVHHGPKDRNSELSCLTAISLDGKMLWQAGRPDPWITRLTIDVAFQIHDIYADGRIDVIYCMNQELHIASGETGKTIRKIPTPRSPGGGPLPSGHNIFPGILGDCILFADLSGRGYASDIILKDRYRYLWAYDRDLELLWSGTCRTGHYPFAYDTDADGKDEILTGYTLFDHDGIKLWSLDEVLDDHADGVAVVSYREGEPPRYMCAASDEGMFFADLSGNILKHHYIGHVQNPAVANFRDDLEGLETVSVNFWGNQGIIHLFDSEGDIYHSFEPNQYGSMCLPLNWTGRREEYYILNANAEEGGAWDGYGRKVLEFPDDGHPDRCYAVLDITGDCRDEIVVWDPHELWVYTQDNNPLQGNLYHPVRNPMYNYSNYQATVSIPGSWSIRNRD